MHQKVLCLIFHPKPLLSAGASYVVGMRSTTASLVGSEWSLVDDINDFTLMGNDLNSYGVTSVAGAAFTPLASSKANMPYYLIVDGIDSGAGGGTVIVRRG